MHEADYSQEPREFQVKRTVTQYPDVDAILSEFLSRVQPILRERLVGVYLFGSLAAGGFDAASDIDVLVVTDSGITAEQFAELRTMHEEIALLDSPWAVQMEVAYLGVDALRRYDSANAIHPQLERGSGVKLEWEKHFRLVERIVLRERGIVLTGPHPRDLIDPVPPQALRLSMLRMFDEWILPLLAGGASFHSRGDQSYTVLSLCRALFTLETGEVASKTAAARWAQVELGDRWVSLIDRALLGRHKPQLDPESWDVQETLEFARFAAGRRGQPGHNPAAPGSPGIGKTDSKL